MGYGKSYAYKYKLRILEAAHEECNSWHCFECLEKFTSSEDLQKHLDVSHKIKDEGLRSKKKRRKFALKSYHKEDVKCKICKESFGNSKVALLRKHMKIVHNLDENVSINENFVITKLVCIL